VSQTNDFNDAVSAIRSASALTEATFLKVGQSLEESIEILAKLTSRFETVLEDLEGDRLGQALEALTWTAAQVRQLGEEQLRDSARFDQMRCLTEAIAKRIAQMQVSLKDVDSLAVNSKIAAANIRASDMDFTVFAAEIGRTLLLARATLDRFAAELNILRRRVAAAHEGQLSFEKCQHEAARSITERLSATITSISQRNQRAAHASQEVKLGSGRVRQRICDAILALQIGDITRQRLEHADHALGLAAPAPGRRAVTDLSAIPALDADELSAFVTVSHRLQSAQMTDAANDFDRDVRQITESLNSLAAEARALRNLGDSAYGAEDRGGGTFITELEGQIGEALALFVDFQTARAEVAAVTATVSDATAGLCGHLRTVQ